MTATITAAQRGTLAKQLAARRIQLRAEISAKLNTQDNPALLGLQNRMEERTTGPSPTWRPRSMWRRWRATPTELRDVEAALARIDDGTYGICVESGEPIPYARLAANPSAARCIACQERLEAASGRAGTSTL